MGRNGRTRSVAQRKGDAASRRIGTPRDRLRLEPAWLTVSQLCHRWQLGRKTIYKFIDCKILPVWRVGTHLYRVAVADILRFEARNRLHHK